VPRALVTGATGLVGSYIVERLLADGWGTRAIVRTSRSGADLAVQGVELRDGNVLDADSFTRAAVGCDVVFHTAAAVTAHGGWNAFRSTNIEGTNNAIDAVRRATARLVHISSVAVYGADSRYRSDGRPTDEDSPFPPLPESAYYARSKRESEQLVLGAHERGSIWATAIRPDVVYGRRDRQFVPRVARILQHGFAPAPGGGGSTMAIVHAANVADAAVRAASKDIAGGRAYNAANDFDVTVGEFFRLGGEGLGRTVRLVSIPIPVLYGILATLARARALVSSRSEPVSVAASVDFLSRDNPFTSQRARDELGWNPRMRPESGIPEAFRWWKDHR
jgi:nucleoside-diphosphate-sugar epimerase